MGTALALTDDRNYMDSIPRMAEIYAKSAVCAKQFQGKPELVEIVAYQLAALDVRMHPASIGMCYVVGNKPGFEAQLQIMLAARHGCKIVPLDDQSDDRSATCKALGKDGEWHRVTVTIDDADRAGWTTRNPNYKTMPDRMLAARAITKAIALHCPEAKLLLPDADREEADWVDAEPVEPDVVMVPSARAKAEVLRALEDKLGQGEHARNVARLMWFSHQLPDHGDLDVTRLRPILDAIRELPADRPQPPPEPAVVAAVDEDDGRPFDDAGRHD